MQSPLCSNDLPLILVQPYLDFLRTSFPGSGKNAEEWTSEDKFAVGLETAALNASELAEYCRREGLFAEQIAACRAACMDITPAMPARIKVSAFTQGVTVAYLLRGLLEREFPLENTP